MRKLRRVVLMLLLLTVPFQAALGATGLLCAAGAHHAQQEALVAHHHDDASASVHHHEAGAVGMDHHSAPQSGSHESHPAADKCKICIECCSTAAPILAPPLAVLPPDTPQRVSSTVERDMISCTVDGLFRPPRSTAV